MKLALGSAQFGLDYGVTNALGQVALDDIEKILHAANDYGIDTIDTACAYGNAEQQLGNVLGQSQSFKLVSKLPPGICASDVHHCVEKSLERLNIDALDGLLVHRADDLLGAQQQAVFAAMTSLRHEGLCQRVGASVYLPNDAAKIVTALPVDMLQVPLNVLDQRFVTSAMTTLFESHGVAIHARSLLLQGTLVTNPKELPLFFQAYQQYFQPIHQAAEQFSVSPLVIALAILHRYSRVEKAVLGCCSVKELKQLVSAYQESAAVADELDFQVWVCHDENLFLPTRWPQAS